MTEDLSNSEKILSPQEIFSQLNSENTRRAHFQYLQDMLSNLSENTIDQEEARILHAKGQAAIVSDIDAELRLGKELHDLYAKAMLLHSFEQASYEMERYPDRLVVNSASPLAKNILELVSNGFTPSEQTFISFDHPSFKRANDKSEYIKYQILAGGTLLQIKTKAFVGAQSFYESWSKGRGSLNQKTLDDGHTKESDDVIRYYTSLPAKTAPPIESAIGYVQPDGKILYVSDSAHRTAAAVLRGDEYVYIAGKLEFYLLDENII